MHIYSNQIGLFFLISCFQMFESVSKVSKALAVQANLAVIHIRNVNSLTAMDEISRPQECQKWYLAPHA